MWCSCSGGSLRRGAVALATVAAFAAAGCGSSGNDSSATASGSDPIKIGGVFDLTGDAAPYGTAFQRSAKIVFDKVNAAGGVNGHKLQVTWQDDQTDPATAVKVTNKLLADGNQIIFGGIYTPIAIAVAHAAQQHDALMYTPGSGAVDLTTPVQKLVFAPSPTHVGISRSVAAVTASLDPQRIGFLEMTNTEGKDDREAMEKLLEGYGLKISNTEMIAQDATNATSQLLKFKQAGVDVIVSSGVAAPDIALLKAEIQQRVFIPIVDEGGGNTPAVLEVAKSNPSIEYYTSSPLGCEMGSECTQEFLTEWKKHYSADEASLYAAEGYGTAQAFVAALEAAKGYSPDELAETLETMPAYTNPILPAPVKFTPTNHVGMSHVAMAGFKNGKPAYINPEVK